ncbi:hypothetical protein Q4I30_005875 [Leishmania utingensis]|uniref:Uncharacterized protein n=1 Tax=Leishmania utingensis TaxID=653362 RepID=A0AAW3A7I1_9TRYP
MGDPKQKKKVSAPEWTGTEQGIEAAKGYLRQGGIVDFYEMISRCILQDHPSDLVEFCLRIVRDIMNGTEITAGADYQPKKIEDNNYMCEKNVSAFLDAWILALLHERPGTELERMQFHRQYLEGLRGGLGKV